MEKDDISLKDFIDGGGDFPKQTSTEIPNERGRKVCYLVLLIYSVLVNKDAVGCSSFVIVLRFMWRQMKGPILTV